VCVCVCVCVCVYVCVCVCVWVFNMFLLLGPSGRIMTLGSTQPPTGISIRGIFWVVKVAGT